MKGKLRDEHIKLYNFLMISIYIIFLPLVIIVKIFELFGEIGQRIEYLLIIVRLQIIEFVFKIFEEE